MILFLKAFYQVAYTKVTFHQSLYPKYYENSNQFCDFLFLDKLGRQAVFKISAIFY